MWIIRNNSIKALETSLKNEGDIIFSGFSLIDDIIKIFESLSNKNLYPEFCGITILKGKRFCLSLFELLLNGFGQEAGAILRPTIETIELLNYIRSDLSRLHEVSENKLPSAGKRAKLINGKLKKIREYLNTNASHFSFTPDSIQHLYDLKNDKFKLETEYNETVFKTNLSIIYGILVFFLYESIESLKICGYDLQDLIYKLDTWNVLGNKVFKFIQRNKSSVSSAN
jgi:hypothetical protein